MKNRGLQGLAIALALGGAVQSAYANGFGMSQSGTQETIQLQATVQNESFGSTGTTEQFGNIASLSRTGALHSCEPLLSGTYGYNNGVFAYGEINPNNVIVDYNNPNREPDTGSQTPDQPTPDPRRPEVDYSRIPQIVPVTEMPTTDTGKHNPNVNPVTPSAIRDAWRRTPKKDRPN